MIPTSLFCIILEGLLLYLYSISLYLEPVYVSPLSNPYIHIPWLYQLYDTVCEINVIVVILLTQLHKWNEE